MPPLPPVQSSPSVMSDINSLGISLLAGNDLIDFLDVVLTFGSPHTNLLLLPLFNIPFASFSKFQSHR